MKDSELLAKLVGQVAKIECDTCGHKLGLHVDKYGCEFDRGDREGDESGPAYALGPCACQCDPYGIVETLRSVDFNFLRAGERGHVAGAK